MTPTGEMTFWDHLEDLRKCIFRILGVFASAVVVLFFFKNFLFDQLILAPSKSDFFLYQLLGADFSMTLVNIVKRSASILKVNIDQDAAYEIALRSRGTPRIANRLLKRVRDFALVMGNGTITSDIASTALTALEIDDLGLDNTDRRMLEAIIKYYNGGPVGLETLAATIGEESDTIEDVYEPYLMQIGFLSRTPRGRCVTRLAYEHLGIPFIGGATTN